MRNVKDWNEAIEAAVEIANKYADIIANEILTLKIEENIEYALINDCECCGKTIGLSESTFTGKQILCEKCK